jgi:hypothetical protein
VDERLVPDLSRVPKAGEVAEHAPAAGLVMLDQSRQPYALIDIVWYRGDVRYRITTWAQDPASGLVLLARE